MASTQDPPYRTQAAATTFSTPAPGMPTQPPGQPGQPPGAANNAPPTPGTATLRGHVLAADTGLPLRKAQVRIFAPDIRENRMATTDTDGRYEFKEVRAGRYTINANKGSYVGVSYGQAKPTDPSKPLQILDNQTVEKLDFSLPRGGVITGRIVDEFGEPMSDVQIAPQQFQTLQGQRRLVPSGRQTTTDDMGEFRLFGIPPGQYYLTATWRSTNPMNEDKTAYAPMYFPGTDNPAQAQRLTIGVGQQISDVVMALKPIRAMRVSGTVTTSDGRPMSGSVMLMSTGGFGSNMAGSGPIRDGSFSINGVAPGEYMLRAQTFAPAGPADAEIATAKIIATGDDITDLRLVGAKPSSITGRVVTDPGVTASLPPGMTLMAMPLDPGAMMIGTSPARVTDDGTFELKSPPGRMRINMMGAAGWAIRSIRLNGSDLTDAGIEFRPNEDVSGLEIELTNKLITVSGLVTNARGEAVKAYSAIAFAQDKEKWKVIGRYQGVGWPDQDGRFKISGLAPADYYIIALDKFDPGQLTDLEFLDSVRAKATPITLREGESRTIDLKIQS